ncbi:uncharacterized protein SCHCODRAFT_01088606 [Schizophyllum commune H4-8]|nr:uncharacterized protein SCHCODRAFT_01088606 [Schizophyllum commune H4-8]KAI5894859.1 hypothetical protein SCHCODRAFT_01088606 [Schizophyllum commune H4-8]
MGGWRYRLLDLDAKLYLDEHDGGNWREKWKYILHAIPYHPEPLRFQAPTLLRRAVESARTTTITSLPLELVDMILDLLNDQLDIFCFAFTCRATWCAAERRIHGFIGAWANGWSGHRIIYISNGDDRTDEDFPRDLNIDSEGEDFCTECGLDSDDEEDGEDQCPCKRGEPCMHPRACNLYEWAGHQYADMEEKLPYDLASSLVGCLEKRFESSTADDHAELVILERLIQQLVPNANLRETNEADLVLCNYTRGLYVRGAAMVERNRRHSSQCNMATVILRRTKWEAHHSGRQDPDDCFLQGEPNGDWRAAWAGDRLDLLTVAQMDELLEEGDENEEPMPWIDATVAVLNDVYSRRNY